MATKAGDGDAVRITTASTSHLEDLRRRQKRYLISMSLRSLCFVGAVVAGLLNIGWLWPILIAGALILPYIAVVLANVRSPLPEGMDLRETAYHAGELSGPTARPSVGPRDR